MPDPRETKANEKVGLKGYHFVTLRRVEPLNFRSFTKQRRVRVADGHLLSLCIR